MIKLIPQEQWGEESQDPHQSKWKEPGSPEHNLPTTWLLYYMTWELKKILNGKKHWKNL